VSANATYSSLAVAGVSLNRSGLLDVNASTLKTALDSKPGELDALFGLSGVGQAFVTSTDNATRFGTGTISSQVNSIDNSVRTLRTRANDAQSRLDAFRQNLVAQYTAMETALSALKSQGSYLTSAIASLRGSTG
jgi:flagellar hook-associated protein 2